MTTINNTTPEALLDEAVKQFEEWRRTREKRSAIPEWLWEKIIPLEKHYHIGKIAMALKLSHTRLKKGLSLAKSEESSITLHECSTRSIFPLPAHQNITLTFSCKNGGTATLSGLDSHDITTAISTLL